MNAGTRLPWPVFGSSPGSRPMLNWSWWPTYLVGMPAADHLVVGAIGPILLTHGVHELVGGMDSGETGHVVRTAGGCQTGVGADLAVVHHQLDLAGLDAERLQSLDGVGQSADIAALSEILPGVEVGYGAVGVELQRHFGDVEHADSDDEPAHAHPEAHMPALGLGRLGLSLVRVVDGLGLFEQLSDTSSRDTAGC